MVTIRIRSWRPAMPSISGPRSTVASNFTVIPFVSGATCSLLIVLSSLYFQGLTCPDHRASKRLLAGVGSWIGRLYRNVDVIDAAGWLGNGNPVFTKAGEMEFYRLAKNRPGIFDGGARRDAAWQIRYVAGKIAFRFFNDDRVAHISLTS